MGKKIKVIEWWQDGSPEPSIVYRLDERGNGEKFFVDLINNAETDGRERFAIKNVTPQEWEEIDRRGLEMA